MVHLSRIKAEPRGSHRHRGKNNLIGYNIDSERSGGEKFIFDDSCWVPRKSTQTNELHIFSRNPLRRKWTINVLFVHLNSMPFRNKSELQQSNWVRKLMLSFNLASCFSRSCHQFSCLIIRPWSQSWSHRTTKNFAIGDKLAASHPLYKRNNIPKADDTRFNICWSTNVAALVQQMLNSVSCHVECWNMPFNTLNVVERCWTKIETSSIPFNTFVQHCSTFVEQQMLQDVEPCIIGLTHSILETVNWGTFELTDDEKPITN